MLNHFNFYIFVILLKYFSYNPSDVKLVILDFYLYCEHKILKY